MKRVLFLGLLAIGMALPNVPVSHAQPFFNFYIEINLVSVREGDSVQIPVRRDDYDLSFVPKVGCSFTPLPAGPFNGSPTPPGEPHADYATSYAPVRFERGEATALCTFTALADDLAEDQELVSVGLVGSPEANATPPRRIIIRDEDSARPYYFSENLFSAGEDEGPIALTVKRHTSNKHPKLWCVFSPYPDPAGDTVTPPGTEGADYTTTTSPIRFPSGSKTGSCTFSPVDDDTAEPTERVKVEFGGPSFTPPLNSYVWSLTDNDQAGIPQ